MIQNKCPLCGTFGKSWGKESEVFKCPNCDSVYSEFGVIIESEKETLHFWN